MLEHYLNAAKSLGLDIDKIYHDCVICSPSGATERSQEKDEERNEMIYDKYFRKWRIKRKRGPTYRITQGYDIQK